MQIINHSIERQNWSAWHGGNHYWVHQQHQPTLSPVGFMRVPSTSYSDQLNPGGMARLSKPSIYGKAQ